MGGVRWDISAAAVLLFALIYFFDGAGLVSALLPAVIAHELGHAAALRLCGARLRRVSVGIFGIEMDYSGRLGVGRTLASVAAGPLAGLIYAVAVCSTRSAFWRLSGAVSFCLSAFNLLPALPLDGGRLVAELAGEDFARRLSRAAATALLLSGTALFLTLRLPALMLAGAWLTIYSFRSE